jgi:NitT/TauT family transport system permease protein
MVDPQERQRATADRSETAIVPAAPRVRKVWWRRRLGALTALPFQVAFVIGILAGWEFVPQIPALRDRSVVFDPFFVSSPTRVAREIDGLLTGRGGSVEIYPYLAPTLSATVMGVAIGMSIGALLGLILSNFEMLRRIFHPFVIAANAVPRIALIPVVVIVFGPSGNATLVVVIMVTIFLAFFNAFEGGRLVAVELLQSAKLLGASRWQIMRFVRLPYVVAWTLASLPLAITIGLIAAVTSEILTGAGGMGQIISTAQVQADASLTFAVAILLAILGLMLTALTEVARLRILHWWGKT